MRAIRTKVLVDEAGVLRLELQTGLRRGEHRALLMVEESELAANLWPAWVAAQLPVIHGGAWPEGFTAASQEIYEDVDA